MRASDFFFQDGTSWNATFGNCSPLAVLLPPILPLQDIICDGNEENPNTLQQSDDDDDDYDEENSLCNLPESNPSVSS